MTSNKEILEKAIQKAILSYDVDYDGIITSRKSGRILKGSVNHKGYRYISVYLPEYKTQKKVTVHRLSALQNIPNPGNLPQVNHIDGNRLNNQIRNLEWCTASYNVSDGFKRGRITWNKGNISRERVLYYANRYPRQLFWLLTKDDFYVAKALWGEQRGRLVVGGILTRQAVENIGWISHLQQMVIAEDPIKYLGETLDIS